MNNKKEEDKTLNQMCQELEKSTIFNMSLSSKELFHSNFWAWLINKYPQFAGIFFEDLKDLKGQKLTVEREKNNIDIQIIKDNKVYIIENKFKSIPYIEQLKEYETKIKEQSKKKSQIQFEKGLLTGIVEPDFMLEESISNWKFLSYEKIGHEIIEILNKSDKDMEDFDKQIIKEYANMIINLYAVIDSSIDSSIDKEKCFNFDFDEKIKNLRIEDICKKLKASYFLSSFKKILKDNNGNVLPEILEPTNHKFVLYQGTDYSDNNAVIDIRYMIDSKNKNKNNTQDITASSIGVQIQGYQYRLVISEKNTSGIKKEAKTLWNKLKNNGELENWFDFNYNKTSKNIKLAKSDKKQTGMKNIFNSFATNSYTFVYQYFKIPKKTPYNDLFDWIKKDLESAKEIIEKGLFKNNQQI